jgi:predicted TIM-barrel fold metal-dependent hydrolase
VSETSGTSDNAGPSSTPASASSHQTANRHGFLERRDEAFEALVGDYSALPRTYLLDDYLRDSGSRRVDGIVWHEFLSEDAVRETRWGQVLADASPVPQALVARVEFRDPALEERLDAYRGLANVTAVRERLAWDPGDPLRPSLRGPTSSPILPGGPALSRPRGWDVAGGLEVLAHQLPEMLDVVRLQPDTPVARVLVGDVNPTGKQPVRILSAEDPNTTLYPYGHGLGF